MRFLFFILLELAIACMMSHFDELDAMVVFSAPVLWLGLFGILVWGLFICVLAIQVADSVKNIHDSGNKKPACFLIATSLGCVGAGLALFDLFSFRLALYLLIQWPLCLPLFNVITYNSSKGNKSKSAE